MEQQKLKSVGGLWENEDDTLLLKLDGKASFKLEKNEKDNDKQPDFKGGVAALWKRTSKKGVKYLFLKVDDDEFVGFKNLNKKEGDEQPNWNIFESRPREEMLAG